jgi:YD repeat-containing protein
MPIRFAVKVLHLFTSIFYNLSRGAKFTTIAHGARSAHYVTHVIRDISIRRATCLIICFGLILSSQPTPLVSLGKSAEKSRAHLTQGPPATNLPNLNETRRMPASVPKIAHPVSAASAPKIGLSAPAAPSMQEGDWPKALIDQRNRVGTSGEDLLSRNFNWGAPIVSLPGRAGMDLNLGLSLNSLIWTKSGTNMYFDLDKGNPSPGFRLGLPEIGATFHNTEAGTGSILVTMPSGRRYEFRRNSALGSNVYEEMGSTYMLLVIRPGLISHLDTTWTLLLTDGTAYKFKIIANNPKCVEIKDRNGNYISIAYTSFEQIRAITDTLERVVYFNYDSSNRLSSITQNWSGVTHTYATFSYDNVTIQTNFLGLDLVGAANGTTISALSRMDMADGKVYAFEYNTYAQVKTIKCYAPNSADPDNFPDDYTLLSSISYDLTPDDRAGQTDCPRFSSRKDWAKDWNDGVTATATYGGDGATWGEVTSPDGTLYKEFFGVSGWQRGLTLKTETWSNGSRKKWTTSTWVNGNPNVSYWLNPRVVETNVYDDNGSQKRTTIDYADFGAVSDVREYDAPPNTSKVLRHNHFEYLRGTAYTGNLNRRLTQLVTSQTVHDGSGALHSKVTYKYDLGSEYLVHQGPPVRHDTANYGASFVQGRGNLNSIRRWDVTEPDKEDKSVASTVGYNTSGAMIFSRDPLNHETKLSYADSFSDSINDRNTLAYPTKITDADNYSSKIQYNYDFGAVTRTEDPKEAAVVNTYDSIGRVEQVMNEVNEAYTRYVYAPNHLYVQSFTTVNDLSSEFYQITVFDGHFRTLAVASDHPGSVGGYKAQRFEYDNMGRQVKQTNPTEITVTEDTWEPAGNDSVWVWSSQDYDWQSRPKDFTNQDGTTKSISYEGCGCSGGDVVTLTDEGNLVNGTLRRRKQKLYHDVLGRMVKSEIYDWNNNVYTTATQAYNTLDQTTTITRRQGSEGASQVATFGYDGHGRISTRQLPSASAPSSFVYNADDTLQMVTDARGASSEFSYNNRRLVTEITYSAPSGVAATPNVSFGYDNAGNRTSMTDGLGSATYHFDELSRMHSETRVLTGVGSFTINYAYNLSGQLTSVTDPANDSVTYAYNKAGEIAAIDGSDYAGVTQYASGFQFRAWGGLKELSYGNGLSLANNYNARLQIQQMEIKGRDSAGSPSLMKAQYQYHPDGNPKFARNLIDSKFDRAWSYDYVGRLREAYTGEEADNYAGVSVPFPQEGPYSHFHQYDVWNNLTSRDGRYWREAANLSTTYNSRNQREGWTYDEAGYLLDDQTNQYVYDAAGRNVSAGGVTQEFDGQGQVIKHTSLDNKVTYYLHSTPLGGKVLTELYGTPGGSVSVGAKILSYVYAGGVVVARQMKDKDNNTVSWVEWHHQDNLAGSMGSSNSDGSFSQQRELDPMGVNVGLSDPATNFLAYEDLLRLAEGGGGGFFPSGRCTIDGMDADCSLASTLLRNGAAVVAPQQTMRWNHTAERFEFFRATMEGSGWANSSGRWVEEMSSSSRTQIATEDVKDANGEIIYHKGDEIYTYTIDGKDHWENSGTEYVNLMVGEFIIQTDEPTKPSKRRAPKGKEKHPDRKSKEKCKEIFQKIQYLARDIYDRIKEFQKDAQVLRLRGNYYERKDKKTGAIKKGGLDTHIEKWYQSKNDLRNNLNDYNKGRCKNRGGGGDAEPHEIAYGWVMLGADAYIPDYKTGLKRVSPEIYLTPVVIESMPGPAPVRVPFRIPFRFPIVVP